MLTSSISAGSSGGSSEGSRFASIDLPAPGGPIIRRLCPPAAATSSARLAVSWPLMSLAGPAWPRIAGVGRRQRTLQRLQAFEVIDELQAGLPGARIDMSAAAQAASAPEALRADQALAERVRADRRGKRAGDRGDRAVKRKLAEHAIALDGVRRDGADRHHQPERDGKIVVAAFLGQVGRREIDGDALWRQREADGVQRAAHPLAALGHGLVGEADNGEGGEPRPDLHLHIDGTRLDALEGDGGDPREHRLKPPFRLSLQARVRL